MKGKAVVMVRSFVILACVLFMTIQVHAQRRRVDTTTTTTTTPVIVAGRSDVDSQLPVTTMSNPDAIAVIIGNKDYKKTKSVEFAINDMVTMKEYLIKVFGYKEENIFVVQNASKGDFELYFGNDTNYKGKLFNAVKIGISDVFVYYAGHGAPSMNTKKGYFVPVECDPQYVDLTGYPLDLFYANIAKISARSFTVVLDACFSGVELLKNVSPMVIEVKDPAVTINNAVVFASSTGSQLSTWYNEKNHGMFTYFFLKGIHDKTADTNKDGIITAEELFTYVSNSTEGVPYYARRLHNLDQTPTIFGKDKNRVLVTF